MVIVAIGPAFSIGMSRLPWNRVGSQFFVAQPGIDEDAKKNRMAQKAMLEKMRAKDFQMDSFAGDSFASLGMTPGVPFGMTPAARAGRASFRQKMRMTA